MRANLIALFGLALTSGAALGAEKPGEDIATFPDVVLRHATYDLPSGWLFTQAQWVVADFDGDGRKDVATRISSTTDGSQATVVYLGRFVVGSDRYTQPVIMSDKTMSGLAVAKDAR